ncbi:bifunctional diaminohydroxyphosphoribosylaminopyrimidine deaminase/5-amino-6-(5-phosphoribosylamino)uracil reductase RibD [Allobacillus sp. GCM10007489]|uniref:bifunctional diaminohydroxyphosphoribosylaminopyrimidine deaminase/5-amino-6-(5-phosphoribosylamino)uracil reductase RibD n=1 Tax=unclassified Allobacillus TaxID=2628859 RepID=UPI0021037225|nr:bifunctional diaminohydroxyphosphoribosylaminopyrimidine deaminase/5-amino-6-(5-phosphoribosylamino)uracil reductase RibD [Allobacillus sp. SKP2-8]
MKESKDYMKHALEMARLTIGQTHPNPSVGAIVVKNGRVVGVGTHMKPGEPHAEVFALQQAGDEAKDADIYVTLEPCAHYGKTPPCAKAIIDAGIKKVFVATLDPNPKVAGKGVQWLRDEGIDVEVGLHEEDAIEINKDFMHFMRNKRPYVTIKTAVSLDGKMTANSGDSKWITGEAARRDVHENRHRHDAILVGIETVKHDDPQLTTRLPHGGINPIRIILDTHLSIPFHAKILTDQAVRTIIICGNHASESTEKQLNEIEHIDVLRMPTDEIDLNDLLAQLAEDKIMSVYVEGGSKVHSSFIHKQLFDELHVYMAPKLIGGPSSKPFFNQNGFTEVSQSVKLTFESIEQMDDDLKIIAKPKR